LASTQSLEELKEKVLLNKIDFVDYMSAELLEELFFRLGMMGFSFDEEHFDKDNTLLFESLKSLILKGLGISYPMQDVAEKIISTDDSKVD
jgi:4-hydroxyphenylpyruvate dioxygenase-like putative hemolysin